MHTAEPSSATAGGRGAGSFDFVSATSSNGEYRLLAIAMGNGGPEVQGPADAVTASNEDEGFAKAVEELILVVQPGSISLWLWL